MKIGPYQVKVIVRHNSKRMILRCGRQEGVLTLTVPRGTTEAEARAFLEANRSWIESHMGEPAWTPQYLYGERHWCLGRLVTLGRDAPVGEAAFREWRSRQLMTILRRLLGYWTSRMQVGVTHVTLQEMSSRWGSCRAATGRLTFNTKLAMYDEALIEETVVHELCHFFHMNHSPAFYQEMTRWLPDWRARKERRAAADVRPLPPAGL